MIRGLRPGDGLLLLLFGGLYFVQGVVEPTACLPSQPLQASLRQQGLSVDDVGRFFATIGLAWSFKPLFGALTDFVPILGTRRRSWLALATGGFAVGFLALAWAGLGLGASEAVLVGIGVAIATTDVVVDAIAVEQGQARGLTGTIQSVQWGSIAVASVLGGVAGGWLAEGSRLGLTWVLCGLLGVGSLALALVAVNEPAHVIRPADTLRTAWAELRVGNRIAILAAVAVFQLLWNFNPFTSNVLQLYSTEVLGFSEQRYGAMVSVQSVAELLACGVYAVYCRRLAFGTWVHLSIALQIASSLCYLGMVGPMSAVAANFVFGLTYQLAALVTLDLAARTSPTASAGTTFAVLMSVANTGVALSLELGGGWYDGLLAWSGDPRVAFDLLVLIGAAATAACWVVVPVLKRAGVPWS